MPATKAAIPHLAYDSAPTGVDLLRRQTQKVQPQVQQAAIFLKSLHRVTLRLGTTRRDAVGQMRCRPWVLVASEVAFLMEEISYDVRDCVVAFLVVGANSSLV